MSKSATRSRPAQAAAAKWPAAFTYGAFVLAIALVLARAMSSEVLRDPMAGLPDLSPTGGVSPPAPVGPGATLGMDLAICLPALLVLGRRAVDKTYPLRWSWTHLPAFAWAGWTASSVLWADDKFAAVIASANVVAAIALFWAASQLVRSWLRLRIVGAAVLALLVVYVGAGLWARLMDHPDQVRAWYDYNSGSDRGTYMKQHQLKETDFAFQQFELKLLRGELFLYSTSHNTYAAMLVLLATVGVGLGVQRLLDERAVGGGIATGAILVPAMLAGVYLLIHTHSRTAGLTAFMAAALLGLLAVGRLRAWITSHRQLTFAGGVAAIALAVVIVVGVGLSRGSLVEKSMTFRWYYWTGAAELVKEHPALGVGWANFGQHYLAVRPPQAPEEVRDPHNFVVRSFAELGLVGGVLLLAWMARMWWDLTRPVVPIMPAAAAPISGRRFGPRALHIALLVGSVAAVINAVLVIDFGQAGSNLLGELVDSVFGGDIRTGNAYVVVEVFKRFGTGFVLAGVLLAGTLVSMRDNAADDRPAPWLLYAMLVALGMLLVHNLIDFSLSEAGPLCLMSMLAGSALGVRQPAPRPIAAATSLPAIIGLCIAGVLWLAAAGRLWVPTLAAESAIADGDARLRGGGSSPEQIAAEYLKAAGEQPLNAQYPFMAARLLTATRGADQAKVRKLYNDSITANPSEFSYHRALAEFEARQTPPDRRRVDWAFQDALRLNPADVKTRLSYAEALADRLHDPAAAAEQYRTALDYDNKLPRDEPKRMRPEDRQHIETAISKLMGG